MLSGIATLKNSLAVSLKTKQIPQGPEIAPMGIYSREMHKNLYKIVHGSFICNSPQLETT